MFNPLKKLPFYRRYSTKSLSEGWRNRKLDWKQAYGSTWNHPHRQLIVWMLKTIPFQSLWEVGVGAGANLVAILKEMKGVQLGGSDVNPDAIKACHETFGGGLFHVEQGDNLLMSDKSVDVVLSDMCLIYVGPLKIKDYLREFKRVARTAVVLVEFHSPSFWDRLKVRLNGHHAHDYRKVLDELGYYDIMVQRIPSKFWPDAGTDTGLRHIITAKT